MSERSGSEPVFPGADQTTPSRSQYFSWINNTNEGATESQTLINLGFFQWLREEYGLELDIYAFDAGAIDGAKFYGAMDSERFRRQFPRGFAPIYEQAKAMGCRLGLWGGPDGFGQSSEEEEARIQMMTSLCRDFHFELFKLDGVCGGLRPEKQDAFVRQMTECRRYAPDLIVLNHRLDLGKGMPHATTFLWEGAETYIDVHMANEIAATHGRVCALCRGVVPDLQRLTEDHGVCLSSCLDYWEDDLVLQAFNRCLLLAPEIYGNPWLLRDDEYPKLARLFNLHRRYRKILVQGLVLPEDRFGPSAVSRGDGKTRLLTLRNLTWSPIRTRIPLDASIGLEPGQRVEVRRFHPSERILGEQDYGSTMEVEVLPFRSCLIMATTEASPEVGVTGCDYEVVRDLPDRPVVLKLLAEPGTEQEVQLRPGARAFTSARLDGRDQPELVQGKSVRLHFPGDRLKEPWHRKIADLEASQVPEDAEALYEATCFAADNNALEVRELLRSGPTRISQVQAARDAFFGQERFRKRLLWDRALFDDDPDTGFAVCRRWTWSNVVIRDGSFRLDLGRPTWIDRLSLDAGDEYGLQPLKPEECARGWVSSNLREWRAVYFYAGRTLDAEIPGDEPIRYIRLEPCPDRILRVTGSFRGKALDRSGWRASNLFASYGSSPALAAWSAAFTLKEAAPGSRLTVAIHGPHGPELAYAALRQSSGYLGARDRSPSFPSNAWECPVRRAGGNTAYHFEVTGDMLGQRLEAVVLLLRGGNTAIRPELWISAYPIPFSSRELVLE